jgi:hypothetical protein
MVNASSGFSSIVVADSVCIWRVSQEIQLQHGLDMLFGPVFEIVPAEHLQVKILQLGGFDRRLDSPQSIEIVRLLCFNQIEKGYDMPPWDNQGVPGIDRVSVEDSHKRPVLEDKGVRFAP